MPYDVIVVGAGAAGLMAAGTAVKARKQVLLLDKNERPARKVMITGKGRCNLTNRTDVNGLIAAVTRNGKFLYSAFHRFSAEDTICLFEELGVPLKTERGNRVFPVSDKAVDIVDALARYAKGAMYVTGRAVELLMENGAVLGVKTEDGRSFFAESVILATGGMSYPTTGSTGDGYALAEAAGHTLQPSSPSLVPLEAHDGWVTDLQGLALKNIGLSVYEEGVAKPIYTDFGELMFAHFGITGPTVLSASAHLQPEKIARYTFFIDLKPALDEKQLDARVLRDFSKYSNKDIKNAMADLLPQRLIPVIIKKSGLNAAMKVNQLTKSERTALVTTLKSLPVHVHRFRPLEEAIVTRGGVKTNEISPTTMESKCCKGLFFAGELMDVDAYTGGFNLQIAFSTGFLAGENA
ncbi:MAG: NAD(P)/FAD-dependent oxidoreductase [Clostridia bacterium]|nr:NAD(P)/FAD-dependent oxidoreductase [Clostridia bacterium]